MHTTYEEVARRAADRARTTRQLADEFLSAAGGNQTGATNIARLFTCELHPGFTPRERPRSSGERLYNRLTKAIGTLVKTGTAVEKDIPVQAPQRIEVILPGMKFTLAALTRPPHQAITVQIDSVTDAR